jgi:CDP-glycerol glycerophosphotransferase
VSDQDLLVQFAKLAELSPKDMNRYVFIGQKHGQFIGNVKHLFLHFAEHRPEADSHFLTCHKDVYRMLREAGLPALFFPSTEAMEILASAGTVVVDNFDFKQAAYGVLARKARVIQLWHGVGFKKIGFIERDSAVPGNYEAQQLEYLYSGYHTVVSTSPFYCDEVFAKAFRAEHVAALGYPRTDVFFRPLGRHDLLNADYDTFVALSRIRRSRHIVLYTPTFRDKVGDAFGADAIDFGRLDEFLGEAGMHLVIKGHHLTDQRPLSSYSNISVFDNAADVYPIMPMTKALVTDYSSIYMDYLLLDRPVIFFCPDYDEYVTRNRELQFPYEEMTPGPKCRTQEALHEALARAVRGDDGFAPERRAMRDKAFLHADGKASRRIAEYLAEGGAPE